MPEDEFEQEQVITLINEDGEEEDFEVIDIIELDDTRYAILLPVEDENDEIDEGEAIILKFDKDEDGGDILIDIEDDEEWKKVAEAWEDMMLEDSE